MNKYHARATVLADPLTGVPLRFASAAEAARYQDLCLLQRAGAITDLRRQVPYPCVVNGVLVCTYVSDFVYVENGQEIVEDVKGLRTPVYKLKAKLVRAVHGVTIREVAA